MIACHFCPERATFAFMPEGILAHGPATITFCQYHLLRYYLSLHYMGWRA